MMLNASETAIFPLSSRPKTKSLEGMKKNIVNYDYFSPFSVWKKSKRVFAKKHICQPFSSPL